MGLFRRGRAATRPLSCRQVGKVLQSFLDGELDDTTAMKVADHLEACRRCGMSADDYLEIKASLGLGAAELPEDSMRRLLEFSRRLAAGESSATDGGDDGRG